mgnify:CR=1 FL=1
MDTIPAKGCKTDPRTPRGRGLFLPEYRVWEQETDPEGSLTVQERLEPHETALIEVEQIL